MFLKFWNTISQLGLSPNLSEADTKNIITANRIAVILSVLNFLIILAVFVFLGYSNSIPYLVFGEFCYLGNVYVLSKGYHKVGRVYLGVYVTLASFVYGILIILGRTEFTPYIYYEIKVLMLASAVLPLLIFSFRDKKMLYVTLAVNVLCLLFFDAVLELFGKGYYQNGGTDKGYNMAQYIFVQSQIFIILSILFLKSISAKFERRNEDLIKELSHVNEELSTQNDQLTVLNREIENRNEQIIFQSAELTRANKTIKEQAELLKSRNLSLEGELEEKNKDLQASNIELKQRNDELEQFSFALSHNLRSPLTSLMGLIRLFKEDKDNREAITDHIEKSVVALDDIVHGLGSILSIKNTAQLKHEHINIKEEIYKVWDMLKEDRDEVQLNIKADAEEVYSVKPFLYSILYNLISNAVKYRCRDKKAEIYVSTYTSGNNQHIEVKDNGIGFDLKSHINDVFKMYKRFHEGIQGNGLGLYLVKEQVALLDGDIAVESAPNEGTKFLITLPIL